MASRGERESLHARRDSIEHQHGCSHNVKRSNMLVVFFGCFVALTFCILNIVNNNVPQPYLDEQFHVRQVQSFCAGDFVHYDPKITTLPGLYLMTMCVLYPVGVALQTNLCTVYWFRMINVLCTFINGVLLHVIQLKLKLNKETQCHTMDVISSLCMTTFPVLYFFSFVYYTDTLSTTLVLAMYLFYLQECNGFASLMGLLSVVVRQTNIVWVFFVFLLSSEKLAKSQPDSRLYRFEGRILSFEEWAEIIRNSVHESARGGPNLSRNLLSASMKYLVGYVALGLVFIIFVIINGGIVVGDRAAHVAVIHLPQLLYFSIFCTFFCGPYFIKNVWPFLQYARCNKGLLASGFLLCSIIVYFNTHVHPYLISDNRHYTFYIWKRLYESNGVMRYALIPVYLFGLFSIFKSLKNSGSFFRTSYLLCLFLCLVPQKLLEFRYFIIPFLILRLHIYSKQWWQVLSELLLFTVINILTLYTFVTKPFTWDSEADTLQRFLW